MSLGALTLFGSMTVNRLFTLVGMAVLGRLLSPDDFGIVALAAFVTGLLHAVVGRHFENVLIRTPGLGAEHVSTAFVLSISWGTTAAALAYLFAEPIADFVGAPAVASALAWLALVPLLDGLRNPGFVLFEKDLRFGRAAAQEVAARFSVLVVSVTMAIIWQNYWAMIGGLIAYSAVRMVLSHALSPIPVRLQARRWREFATIGSWMTGASVATYLRQRIDRFLLGAELGVTETGRYRVGDDIASIATLQIDALLQRVVYPGLSQRSENDTALRRAYSKAQSTTLCLLMPAGVLTSITATDLLRVIVGPQWLAAAPVIMIFGPVFALNGLTSGVRAIMYIRGAMRALFLRDILMIGVAVPVLWAGVELGGFLGIALARALVMVTFVAITLQLGARALGTRWYDPVIAGRRTFAACGAMVLAAWVLAPHLPEGMGFLQAALRLCLTGASCGVTYFAVHGLLWMVEGRPEGAERQLITIFSGSMARLGNRLAAR